MRLPGSILQGILARSALTLLRLYLGLVFLVSGWEVMRSGSSAQLAEVFGADSEAVAAVAGVIAWGELLVGCCLLLGLATRLAAALALLLALTFLLVEDWSPGMVAGAYAGWGAISLALLIGAAGRTLGIDALLARRWPRSPFW